MSENKLEVYTIESAEAEKLRERFRKLIEKDEMNTMNKLSIFAQELRKRYSPNELHNYEAYCVVVGSTPHEKPEFFDFEGDESIVQFITRLESEIEGSKEK